MCGGGGDKPDEMESRLALSQQAATMLKRYGNTFVALENQFMDTVQNQFSDASYDSSIAAGMNQAAAQYEPAIQDMQAAAFNRGFDPTSGAFQSESEALRGAKDPERWEQIYQANRNSLQSPSDIRVGQTLVIPQ